MSFLTEQIDAQKNIIINLNAAIVALNSGVISYEIDTGQNKTKVTRSSLTELIKARTDAMNYLAELERAAGITDSYTYGRPDF